jgi:hypothetical protein
MTAAEAILRRILLLHLLTANNTLGRGEGYLEHLVWKYRKTRDNPFSLKTDLYEAVQQACELNLWQEFGLELCRPDELLSSIHLPSEALAECFSELIAIPPDLLDFASVAPAVAPLTGGRPNEEAIVTARRALDKLSSEELQSAKVLVWAGDGGATAARVFDLLAEQYERYNHSAERSRTATARDGDQMLLFKETAALPYAADQVDDIPRQILTLNLRDHEPTPALLTAAQMMIHLKAIDFYRTRKRRVSSFAGFSESCVSCTRDAIGDSVRIQVRAA